MKIEKCSGAGGSNPSEQAHALQEQTSFQDLVSRAKPNADNIHDSEARERHLELFLGMTNQSITRLIDVYDTITPSITHDHEIQDALVVMKRITNSALAELHPFVEKFHTDKSYGHEGSEHLLASLFSTAEGERHQAKHRSPYRTLILLTGLDVYLSSIESHLLCLTPVSQALWDDGFQAAVAGVKVKIQRMKNWVQHLITVRGPQTLVSIHSNVWRDL